MSIQFEEIPNSALVISKLEELMPLHNSNPDDVKSMLSSLGITCSELIQKDIVPDYNVTHLVTKPYDSFIQCTAEAPSSKWMKFLVTNKFLWHIHFHFHNNHLTEIVVTKEEKGPL